MKNSGCYLVSWSFSNNNSIVIIGEQKPGKDVEVINAFQGQEAVDIINKLTENKNGEQNEEK